MDLGCTEVGSSLLTGCGIPTAGEADLKEDVSECGCEPSVVDQAAGEGEGVSGELEGADLLAPGTLRARIGIAHAVGNAAVTVEAMVDRRAIVGKPQPVQLGQ